MKKFLFIVLVICWLSFSLYIRLVGLNTSPISLGFDEASIGYNAYSLYLTGKDEYGNSYPLSLRSFNDFKPALYSYLSIPFIHFLGLNEISVRAPSAVLGTIALMFFFLIFKKVSGSSWGMALIFSVLVSMFPWRIHFSRVAFEANISMAFFTIFVWFLLNFEKNLLYKILSVAMGTLAVYSYHSARVAVPLLLFIKSFDFKFSNFRKPLNFWPLLAVVALYIPLFMETQASNILTRFNQTNIFTHFYPFTPSELLLSSNPWLSFIANPLYYLLGILTGHLFAYLSPQNLSLLLYPGVIKSAQVISGTGMLGSIGGILFTIGLFGFIRQIIKDPQKRIIAYWIIAGIAPAAITWEWFYPLRSLNIYPALEIIAGFGFIWLTGRISKLKKKFLKLFVATALSATLLMSSIYNMLNELNFGAWETNGEFQPGGYKEGAPILLSLMDNYQTVYIDSNHAQNYTIFWFYLKYPPQKVQAIAHLRNKPGIEGPPTFDFDKIKYKKYDWPSVKKEKSFVFWTSSEVKEDEIKSTPGAKMYKIQGPLGNWPATIITKE